MTSIAQVERFAGTLPAAELREVGGAGYPVHRAASSAMIRAFSLVLDGFCLWAGRRAGSHSVRHPLASNVGARLPNLQHLNRYH